MFAEKSKLPVCIHTPRNNKEDITKQILDILNEYDIDPQKIVVDHTTENTIKKVLERGHHAGITISYSKLSLEEAKDMIKKYKESADRIMVNSDAVKWNPKEYQMFLDLEKYLLNKDTERILGYTARNFFNI